MNASALRLLATTAVVLLGAAGVRHRSRPRPRHQRRPARLDPPGKIDPVAVPGEHRGQHSRRKRFRTHTTYIHNGQCAALSCTNGTTTATADNVGASIQRAERLRSGQSVRTDCSPRFRRDSDILTRRLNARHVDYVDLHAPFKGRTGNIDDTHQLASDGDHPNAAGHEAIARALMTS